MSFLACTYLKIHRKGKEEDRACLQERMPYLIFYNEHNPCSAWRRALSIQGASTSVRVKVHNHHSSNKICNSQWGHDSCESQGCDATKETERGDQEVDDDDPESTLSQIGGPWRAVDEVGAAWMEIKESEMAQNDEKCAVRLCSTRKVL